MKKPKIKNIRLTVQIIMLLIVTIAALNHYLTTIGKQIPWISEAVFHYICPVCGVTSIYQFFASSSLWVIKLKSSLGIIIGLAIILSIIFGPVICGFICPFGAIQDLLSRIGKKVFKRKYNKFIPKEVDEKLKYLRYVMLVLTVILTAISSVTLLEAINPYHAYLSVFNRKFTALGIIGFGILALVIGLSLFVQRPWCRYICPYGAFLGLFNRIKVFRIFRSKKLCINCKKCTNQCPMGINVHEREEVRSLSCISCMECVDKKVCPKDNTISFTSQEEDKFDKPEELMVNEIFDIDGNLLSNSQEEFEKIKIDNLYIDMVE